MLKEGELAGTSWDDFSATTRRGCVWERELDNRLIVHIVGDDVDITRVAALFESVDSECPHSIDPDGQWLVVTDSGEELSPHNIGWADVAHALYHDFSRSS